MADASPPSLSRRAALGLAAAAPLALLAACRRGPEPPAGTAVPLAALAEGLRVRVLRGEEPVEVLRTGDEFRARSLWCTHLGCEVRWNEATATYDCPCHEGRFDADGRVVAGPPTGALRAIPVRVDGDRLVLLPAHPASGAPRRG
jgi:Rieske Fe-S protein